MMEGTDLIHVFCFISGMSRVQPIEERVESGRDERGAGQASSSRADVPTVGTIRGCVIPVGKWQPFLLLSLSHRPFTP